MYIVKHLEIANQLFERLEMTQNWLRLLKNTLKQKR